MAELHNVFAVKAVDCPTELSPKRNEIVTMDRRVACDDPPLHQDRHEGGDDRADAALGKPALPVDAGLRERAILIVEASRDVGAEHPVLDGEAAKLERREDRILWMVGART